MNTIRKIFVNGAIGAIAGLYAISVRMATDNITDDKNLGNVLFSAVIFSTLLPVIQLIYKYVEID